MYQFYLPTKIKSVDSFRKFAEEEKLCPEDLIITNEFIYEPFMKSCGLECKFLYQEKYGSGEPNDEMLDAIRRDIPEDIKRIIAVGGGTVIDIAKVLTFSGDWKTEDIFMGRVVPEKTKALIVVPTTCGTGSEVTNVTICELKQRHTKEGLALENMYADTAVLIPEMVRTLPYKFFATSSIDALIHAVESYLSPKAIPHSEAYSEKAIEMIVSAYRYVEEYGRDTWTDKSEDFLNASNLAGIAFGYAGCAAVHALSYPLGGSYHIPHGEANQIIFEAVLQKYKQLQPSGKLNQLENILAKVLYVKTENALDTLYALMNTVLERKSLKEYGIREEELYTFASSVIESQQRLLKNNYTALTSRDMVEIYKSCY